MPRNLMYFMTKIINISDLDIDHKNHNIHNIIQDKILNQESPKKEYLNEEVDSQDISNSGERVDKSNTGNIDEENKIKEVESINQSQEEDENSEKLVQASTAFFLNSLKANHDLIEVKQRENFISELFNCTKEKKIGMIFKSDN